MSIRVNKVLGYGTNHLRRFSHSFDHCKELVEGDEAAYSFAAFSEWISNEVIPDNGLSVLGRKMGESEAILLHYSLEAYLEYNGNSEDDSMLRTIVADEAETYALNNVDVLVAGSIFHMKEWFRHDNVLDYYEAYNRNRDDPIQERFSELDVPIHPYEGWDFIDGTSEERTHRNLRKYLLKILQGDDATASERLTTQTMLDDIAHKYGLKDAASYEAEVHPTIPVAVVLCLLWLRIFPSATEIRRALRPCIYEYWS